MSDSMSPHAGTPSAQPKQMSSRLLTMKFMQRASNTATTPSRSQPQTPGSDPPSKRRKTDHTPDSSTPNTPAPASEPRAFVDRSDVRAALKAESAFEALAAARRAELGFGTIAYETQWVLDVDIPTTQNGTHASHSNTSDTESDEEEETDQEQTPEPNGRQTYGSFKRRKASATTPSTTTPSRYDALKIPTSSSDEGELSPDEDADSSASEEADHHAASRAKQHRKKAAAMNLDDDAAMSALDRVDLSKSSYARAKGAVGPSRGGGKFGQSLGRERERDGAATHPGERRGGETSEE